MKSENKILLGISFVIFGILSLLNYFSLLHLSVQTIHGIVFIFFGIITVYRTFGNSRRGVLSFGVLLFLLGILLILKSHFELLDTRGIIFTSILFIGGSISIMLFFDNTKEKVFLYSGLTLVILSGITITLFKSAGLFSLTNKVGNYLEYFWPIVLIILGMGLFINRKK